MRQSVALFESLILQAASHMLFPLFMTLINNSLLTAFVLCLHLAFSEALHGINHVL